MTWVYRNVVPGRMPPCPVCSGTLVDPPPVPSGKYRCKAGKCGAAFQASWKRDEAPARAGQGEKG